MLAQREYKRRHDNVAKYVHWRICEKYELDRANKWYEHKPDGAIENANYKILWDVMIQCDKEIEARRQNIVVVDKQRGEVKIIDVAIPGDVRVCEKELEKIDKSSSSSGAMPYGLGDHGPPFLSISATVNYFAAPV